MGTGSVLKILTNWTVFEIHKHFARDEVINALSVAETNFKMKLNKYLALINVWVILPEVTHSRQSDLEWVCISC